MNVEFIKQVAEKIELPQKPFELALQAIEEQESLFLSMQKKSLSENNQICLSKIRENRPQGAVFCLAFCLAFCEETYRKYQERQLPDTVFYASMRDVTVWVKTAKARENIEGLLEIGWLLETLYLHLFRIERLQFQFFKTDYICAGLRFFDRRKAPIPNHSPVLNIHIPEDGPLDFTLCQLSIQKASAFFAEYYPEYAYKGFICDSWLLDPANQTFMDKSCNILKFSTLFSPIFASRFPNKDLQKRVFGKVYKKRDFASLPETTSLQKNAKAYLLGGGKTRNGYGFLSNLSK